MDLNQSNIQSQIDARRQYRASLWDIAPPHSLLSTTTSAPSVVGHPTSRDTSGRRIYVGSLNYELTETDIQKLFSTFGVIVRIEMPRDPLKGTTKGYCFIEFSSSESAKIALETMNGFILHDRPIKVNLPTSAMNAGIPVSSSIGNMGVGTDSSSSSSLYSTGGMANSNAMGVAGQQYQSQFQQQAQQLQQPHGGCRLYVGSIDYSITEANIRDLFSVFGAVQSVHLVPHQQHLNQHKGYGFVEFENETSAVQAMEKLNKFQLKDRQLIVAPASSRSHTSSHTNIHTYAPQLQQQQQQQPHQYHQYEHSQLQTQSASAPLQLQHSLSSNPHPSLDTASSQTTLTAATNIVRLENMMSYEEYLNEAKQEDNQGDMAMFKEEVREGCIEFGEIVNIDVIPRSTENRVDVFVTYRTSAQAALATKQLDQRQFGDSKIKACMVSQVQ